MANNSKGIVPSDNENLKALEALTHKLVSFKDIVRKATSDYVELEAVGGSVIGFNLFKDSKVLISRFLFTDGAVFAKHCHEGIQETLIVVEGRLDITFEDKTVSINERECLSIQPNVPHSGKAFGTTWVICISMPPEPMFVSGEIMVRRKND